jgi:hypothetical protein
LTTDTPLGDERSLSKFKKHILFLRCVFVYERNIYYYMGGYVVTHIAHT